MTFVVLVIFAVSDGKNLIEKCSYIKFLWESRDFSKSRSPNGLDKINEKIYIVCLDNSFNWISFYR